MTEIVPVRTFEDGKSLGAAFSERANAYFVARRESDEHPWTWFVGTFKTEHLARQWILDIRAMNDTSKAFRPRRG